MSAGPSPPPLPRRPRNWLPAIIVTCVFSPFLILLIAFISYRVSNASAVRRLEAEIKKRGEPLTLADLAATYPPIPDEDNGAVLLLQLWERENPEFWEAFRAGERTLRQRPEIRWDDSLPFLGADARRVSRTTTLLPENMAAGESFLKQQKEHLDDVRTALRKSRFRFPIRIADGNAALLPHLGEMKTEAQCFRIEALLATEHGHVEEAINALENIFRSGDTLASEPFLISQLVRVSCYSMTLDAAERLLSRQSLTVSQLSNLEALLIRLHLRGTLRFAFIGERVTMLSVFDLPDAALGEALSSGSPDGETSISPQDYRRGMGLLGFIGLAGPDRRLMLETMSETIALADQDNPEALKRIEEIFSTASSKARRFPPKMFSALLLPSLEKAASRFATIEARRRAVTAAIAVERYRLAKEGSTPESLDELGPQFLPSIPSDPFDGEPLRYKKLPTGYVVYSIGPDRADDGGKERPPRGPQKNFDVTFVVER